jgi:hypothetical protein
VAYTLADLSVPQDEATLTAALVAKLQAAGMPTDQWQPAALGGLENANVSTTAGYLAAYASPRVAAMAVSTLLENGTGDLLAYDAEHFYRLDKRYARQTIQSITLSLDSRSTALSFGAGELWFRSALGHLYRSIDPVAFALGADGTYALQHVRAAAYNDLGPAPGSAYNADGAGTITEMVTPYPDLKAVNAPPSDWTAQVVSGPSRGTIKPAFATPGVRPPTYSTLKIGILGTGDEGAATFQWSTDGGATWIAGGTLRSGMSLDAYTTISASNDPVVHPGFLAGDLFSFQVADAIVQYGSDDETDDAIRRRCRTRWPGLGEVPTEGLFDLWAHVASDEVDRVIVDADPTIAGLTHMRIASAQGPASPGAVSAVQDYISERLAADGGVDVATGQAFEKVSVVGVDVVPIAVTSKIFVYAADLERVQQQAHVNWVNYLRSIPIGGFLAFSSLIKAIMDAGALDIDASVTTIAGFPFFAGRGLYIPHAAVVTPAGAGLFDPLVVWTTP